MSLHEQILNMKKKIAEDKKKVPTNIGKNILKNFKVPTTTKSGKSTTRNIYDFQDFIKHFDVVPKGTKSTGFIRKPLNKAKKSTAVVKKNKTTKASK